MSAENVGSVGSVGSVAFLGEVLTEISNWFGRFIYVQNPRDLDILAVWTFHTWICEDLYTSPRLLINSPVPGSGKTTLLEHLNALTARGIMISSLGSPAVLTRLIQNQTRTLLIDEADRNLSPKRPGVEDLLSVINSGYKIGSTRPVTSKTKDGFFVEEHSTFSPVAIAGNGTHLADDTRQRCITIQLLPDRNGETEESDWETLDPQAKALADVIANAAAAYREDIKTCKPALPSNCKNRHRERWQPLAKIAETASAGWREKITNAIVEDLETIDQLNDSGDGNTLLHVQLVEDLHKVFAQGEPFMPTARILQALEKVNPGEWSAASYFGKALTATRLATFLTRNYGVSSFRFAGGNIRGYHQSQFVAIWQQLGITTKNLTDPTDLTEVTENA